MLRVLPLSVLVLTLVHGCAPPPPQMPADDGFSAGAPATSAAERERNRRAVEELQARAQTRRAQAAAEHEAMWAQILADVSRGFVQRAHLDVLLDAGPQTFLQHVALVPAQDETGDVIGFRVASLSPEAARLGDAGLLEDDVLVAINAASVLRPDAFFDAWESLREADEVVLAILREGAPLRLDAEVR